MIQLDSKIFAGTTLLQQKTESTCVLYAIANILLYFGVKKYKNRRINHDFVNKYLYRRFKCSKREGTAVKAIENFFKEMDSFVFEDNLAGLYLNSLRKKLSEGYIAVISHWPKDTGKGKQELIDDDDSGHSFLALELYLLDGVEYILLFNQDNFFDKYSLYVSQSRYKEGSIAFLPLSEFRKLLRKRYVYPCYIKRIEDGGEN